MHATAPICCTLTLAAAALAIAFPAAAQSQADRDLAVEARLAAKHPGLFKRSGKTLRIGGNSFTDRGDCHADDANCARWRAVAVHGDYVGVWNHGYEQSEYLLVNPKGSWTTIGDPPISSPSGRRFFVLYNDEHDWNPLQGAAVWDWAGLHRLRVVDPALASIANFIGWRGDSCVELKGSQGSGPAQPLWLAEQGGDWQLSRKRPPVCTG